MQRSAFQSLTKLLLTLPLPGCAR